MNSQLIVLIFLTVTLVTSYGANSEQLSTVFVLETSDSSQVQQDQPQQSAQISSNINNEQTTSQQSAQLESKSLDSDSNTRVITDDEPTSSRNKQELRKQESPIVVVHTNNEDYSQGGGELSQAHHQDNAASREQRANESKYSNSRKEEESVAATQTRQRVSTATRSTNQQQLSGSSSTNQPRPKSTTTTISPYRDRDQPSREISSSSPKTEERLLISITSDDDDYRPPSRDQHQLIPSSNTQTGVYEPQTSSNQQQKRKPSITISIQDANINKHSGGGSGGSGSPALIVRPSENGQSIVIATVSSNGHIESNPQLNKQNHKPTVTSSSNHQINNDDNSYNREPANTNIHRPSTQRPYLNEYNSVSSNRPIVSTLIDQPRPPIQVINEDRPVNTNEESNSGYGSSNQQRPPTSRPNRPIQDQLGYESSNNEQRPSSRPTTVQEPTGYDNNQLSETPKYPLNEKFCGLVHETKIVGGEEANPDDFLWMAAIIKSKPKEGEARPFCGGSLITRRHILTAAHCLEGLAPRDVLVRLGSYDFDDSTASSLSADYAIDQFRVPAQYSKKTHAADLAIMRLKTPLANTDNYKTVCMPQPRRSYVGSLGTVTGYGSQSQTFRRATPKLRQVTVPIWENRKCSTVYKKNLTESFLCAGYEEGGKDACQGDSGGPLMTEGPNERTMIVGVVSFGIGCGTPGYPGVYTRVSTYLDWIEKNTKE